MYRVLRDRAEGHRSRVKGDFRVSWCLQTYSGQAQGSGVSCSKQREQLVQRLRDHREPGSPLQTELVGFLSLKTLQTSLSSWMWVFCGYLSRLPIHQPCPLLPYFIEVYLYSSDNIEKVGSSSPGGEHDWSKPSSYPVSLFW